MIKLSNKQLPIILSFFIGSVVLIYKLAELQLFDDTYKKLAEKTILDKQTIYPARGLIYDRNEKLLTFNKPIYDLEVVYRNVNPNMDTSLFCSLLQIDKETFIKNLDKNWKDKRYHKALPFTFLSKINPEVYASFQEHLFQFPGFYPLIRNIRAYPHSSGPHMLGYLGEVDNNIISISNNSYEAGDFIGMSGLEKQYEDKLKGEKGFSFLLRDNVGREVSSFNEGKLDSLSKEGLDLITTIDLDLQKYCELLMENKRGSIVALEPGTGEILTMVSTPSYDPNALNLDEDRSKAFAKLTADKEQKPLLNRAIAARYPPGSIFKPVLSLIAFQEGVFSPKQTVQCQGYYQYKTFKYGCHEHETPYNIQSGLLHSCNSYFFSMVRALIEKDGFYKPEIGLNTLSGHLNDFGLGQKLGVDLFFESPGFVPTSDYYKYLYRQEEGKWYSTYIMSIGIGQGELELTTLQMANLATIIANRGWYYKPHLVKGFSSPSVEIDEKYKIKNRVKIDQEHFVPVIEGMHKTITRGTGYKAYLPGVDICGKTGTSENSQSNGKDHSVFFAFAPKDDPKIALAVYVENAGFGGDIAAPIASLVIEKYLKKEIKRVKLESRIQKINLVDNP
ncbi:MAG: penicillin-binding protein 2 [Saprospiraceae bacterium]|nr:penicillin-binding protein 2 [Bacteroidia bacterium]NNE13440.1 penicillin-binding protein 2 [Saprospiraceae bacterium]NNL93809.1 penicillin-binding protein 2 [Saprospiraceae bacterium]